MKKLFTAITAMIIGIIMLTSCSSAPDASSHASATKPPVKSSSNGEFAKFTAIDIDGNTVTQDILKGHKLTMINIWGTFCEPCRQEMPLLGEINREYADKGLQVIGIITDAGDRNGNVNEKTVTTAKDIISQTKADYLHILPGPDLYNIKLKNVMSIPETIFTDENGNLVGKSYMGMRSKSSWTKIIDGMLSAM